MNAPFRIIDRPERRKLTVTDFELLVAGGAFVDCGKTELIDGDIYAMNAQYSRHARAKVRLATAMANRLAAIGSDLEVLTEISVRVAEDSMPEPDVVLTRYRGDRAVPADTVALVVEISDETQESDLGRKVVLYGAANIPEYWVVDLERGEVIIHYRPQADGYGLRSEVLIGERLVATTIDGLDLGEVKLVG